MAVAIHPHKGYLNTDFHIHYRGKGDLNYVVYNSGDDSCAVLASTVSPNRPHKLKIHSAGEYVVRFDNGQTISVLVQDAYKFGGSKLKSAFIFDNCPWLFIVMYDRTYFHNRVTGEEYVETISPDEILEVSEDYVLFKTRGQKEATLYSLIKQKPIAEFEDIITYNSECIVYEEIEDDNTCICIYSILKNECVVNIAVEDYEVFGDELFFYRRNLIQKTSLSSDFKTKTLLLNHKGLPIAFLNPNLAVTYINGAKRSLFIYSIEDSKIVKQIDIKGYLHSINGKCLFNIYDRRLAINRFNIEQAGFPEATIVVQYDDIEIFDCDWNIFYRIKSSKLTKSPNRMVEEEIVFTFDSCDENTDIHLARSNCEVYIHNQSLMIETDNETYLLTPNSSFTELEEGKYDKRKFENDGIIHNAMVGESLQLQKAFLSKEAQYKYFESDGFMSLQAMGYKYCSPKDKFAVAIEHNAVYLITRQTDCTVKTASILEKLFDYTTVH